LFLRAFAPVGAISARAVVMVPRRAAGRAGVPIVGAHRLRHSAATSSLHAGVDISTIALWLGHESTKSTEIYLHADLALKEQALARTAPPSVGRRRFRAPDSLLAFLAAL
ncbi:MAG: tyrosine-type recombinase/integrase, partial [Acidimicrobiales bacterium]